MSMFIVDSYFKTILSNILKCQALWLAYDILRLYLRWS